MVPTVTWAVKPLLSAANAHTWPPTLQQAWDNPDTQWFLIAEGHPLWELILSRPDTKITFYYPGPCGTTEHTLRVAFNPTNEIAFWIACEPKTVHATPDTIQSLQSLLEHSE